MDYLFERAAAIARVEFAEQRMDSIDKAIELAKELEQAALERTDAARSCIDDLVLALDLALGQIEQAKTLVEAQQVAANIRAGLKEGWG